MWRGDAFGMGRVLEEGFNDNVEEEGDQRVTLS